MQIIVPKHSVEPKSFPLFFLAGPIRGGGDWQTRMCLELKKLLPDGQGTVACPCRWSKDHQLASNFAKGKQGVFQRQTHWERHYLEEAAQGAHHGCIIFWLGEEDSHNPHPGPEPYAMDTRGELGEWRGRMIAQPDSRVVIGAHPNFHGLSQIQCNFEAALGKPFSIHESIARTAKAALDRASK